MKPSLLVDGKENNKMELKETLKNMEIGDVITIEFNDGIVDYITKTNWFETIVFILGGMGRTGAPTIVGSGIEDIDVVISNICTILNEDVKVTDTKGKIKIQYESDEVFIDGSNGNFYYDNDKI